MKEKKATKIILLLFFLMLVILGIFIYKLYIENFINTEKLTELRDGVNNLNELQKNNNISSNTDVVDSDNKSIENNIISNVTNNIPTKDTNKVILEGDYVLENSDIGYKFYKNGNVTILGNVSEIKGTYVTSGENEIIITLKEEVVFDIDTGKTTSTSINRTETIKVVDQNTLLLNNADGKNQKLVKYTNN